MRPNHIQEEILAHLKRVNSASLTAIFEHIKPVLPPRYIVPSQLVRELAPLVRAGKVKQVRNIYKIVETTPPAPASLFETSSDRPAMADALEALREQGLSVERGEGGAYIVSKPAKKL